MSRRPSVGAERPRVGADPVADATPDSARGQPSGDSFTKLLETTFFRLFGLISDPQDMIQQMEAEILRLRRNETQEESVSIANETFLEAMRTKPPTGYEGVTVSLGPTQEVVSLTQDSKESAPQQPNQLEKKLYYVRLTLEEADGTMQPSPVNFSTTIHEMRLGGPLHRDSARCVYGDLDALLEKLGTGVI